MQFRIFLLVFLQFSRLRSSEIVADIFETILENLHGEPISSTNPPTRIAINTSWITQKLDHFNESDRRVWQMRYKSNDFFFENGGPIFIFVGAEWEITDRPLKSGPIYDMAKHTNGYLFYTEHRYYGESHPTKNMELHNLRYLKMEQSLADLAHFIKTMKKTVVGLADSKVILIGGSLSGAMVTWFRRIYPDLTVGGWASSAPIKFQVDFYEYKEVVGEAIKLIGGDKCYIRVKNAFEAFAAGIKKKSKDLISKVLKLCSNFNPSDEYDVQLLFHTLTTVFGAAVQSHNYGDIESHCSKILSGKDDTKGVAAWIHERLKTNSCLPVSYKGMIKSLKRTDWKSSKFARQWFYQTCTQLGWFHTFSSENQPFGYKRVPLEYHVKFCSEIYGKKTTLEGMQMNSEKMNAIYGGLNPSVENMYYTHGYLDPWRPLGVQENYTCVKIIKGYSHCKDLTIRKSDKEDMVALRKDIQSKIYHWLGLE